MEARLLSVLNISRTSVLHAPTLASRFTYKHLFVQRAKFFRTPILRLQNYSRKDTRNLNMVLFIADAVWYIVEIVFS